MNNNCFLKWELLGEGGLWRIRGALHKAWCEIGFVMHREVDPFPKVTEERGALVEGLVL